MCMLFGDSSVRMGVCWLEGGSGCPVIPFDTPWSSVLLRGLYTLVVAWVEFHSRPCTAVSALFGLCAPFHLTHTMQVDGFSVYTTYGGNHENAQKLVFEMEKDPVVKGFFTVSLTAN